VFRPQLAEDGRILPDYVQREFEDYLKCGRLEYGFLACAAKPATRSAWLRSVANAAVSAPVAAHAAWPRVRPCS